MYAIYESSRHVTVGTIAAASLLIYQTISSVVNPEDDPVQYLHLVFTATFITFQAALGFLRLEILVGFLSHSTITGFMGGTAVILCLQQLKGIFGLKHFATQTRVVPVVKAIWTNRHEVRIEQIQTPREKRNCFFSFAFYSSKQKAQVLAIRYQIITYKDSCLTMIMIS